MIKIYRAYYDTPSFDIQFTSKYFLDEKEADKFSKRMDTTYETIAVSVSTAEDVKELLEKLDPTSEVNNG